MILSSSVNPASVKPESEIVNAVVVVVAAVVVVVVFSLQATRPNTSIKATNKANPFFFIFPPKKFLFLAVTVYSFILSYRDSDFKRKEYKIFNILMQQKKRTELGSFPLVKKMLM